MLAPGPNLYGTKLVRRAYLVGVSNPAVCCRKRLLGDLSSNIARRFGGALYHCNGYRRDHPTLHFRRHRLATLCSAAQGSDKSALRWTYNDKNGVR